MYSKDDESRHHLSIAGMDYFDSTVIISVGGCFDNGTC